jgi:cyclophilin family peptidyl-prolyl cis-trans isomerase
MSRALFSFLAPLLAILPPGKDPLTVSLDGGKGVLVAGAPCVLRVSFHNGSSERAKLEAHYAKGVGLHLRAVELAPGAKESLDTVKLDFSLPGAQAEPPYEIPPGGSLTGSVDVSPTFGALAGVCDAAEVWFESGDLKGAPVRLELVEDLSKRLVVLETNKGVIKAKLDTVNAPLASRNFARHVKSGYYDGTLFHRVIPGFMAQGGDPNSRDADPSNDGGGGAPYNGRALRSEISAVKHERGTLSMARNGDPLSNLQNPQLQQMHMQAVQTLMQVEGKPAKDMAQLQARFAELQKEGFFRDRQPFLDSSGSQFFLCFGRVEHLDGGYTAFGKVVEGDDVLTKLEAGGNPDKSGRTTEPLKIEKARLE